MKMIIGTGIDITELERVEKMVQRQSAFITRILTKNEKERYEKLSSRRKGRIFSRKICCEGSIFESSWNRNRKRFQLPRYRNRE